MAIKAAMTLLSIIFLFEINTLTNSTYKKLAFQCFVRQFCGLTNIRSSYEPL